VQYLIILVFSLLLAWPAGAWADVVGHLTQVEGRVEILKGGQLPANVAKAQDGVEPGDVLRTKSLSRAQITFIDNTTVTVSPESRLAVEEYSFDPAKSKRSAVLQLFQGLAHLVVSQVYKVQEPDFLVKTHTGVLGVRGTEVGIRMSPNDTTFLCFKGLVRVANIFPEVSAAPFEKAGKIAAAFGGRSLDLNDKQGSVVARGLPPTLAFTITDEDIQLFMNQLKNGLHGRTAGGGPGADTGLAGNLPDAVSPGLINRMAAIMNNLTMPPRVAAAATAGAGAPVNPIETFTFSETFSTGSVSFTPNAGFTTAVFSGSLSGSRSLVYPGSFILNIANLTAATAPPASIFPSTGGTGSFFITANSITVSGLVGGTFSGTMTMTALASFGSTSATFTLSGPVSIAPNGVLTFTPGGTFVWTISGTVPISFPGNITAGSFSQTTTLGAIRRGLAISRVIGPHGIRPGPTPTPTPARL
jgi:hypothetical protein